MAQNQRRAFEIEGLVVAKAYLVKCLEPKLTTQLRTLKKDYGELEHWSKACEGHASDYGKQLYGCHPLWLRCMMYFNHKQIVNESFLTWWSRKIDLKSKYDFDDRMKSHD